MKEKKQFNVKLFINILAILILLGIFIFVFFYFYDEIKLLDSEEGIDNFINKIQSTGFFGGLILITIQILQVVVAFIPGEFVEIASGVMFGPILGLIICLIGLNLGTMIIFGLVKLLGKPFVKQNVSEKEHKYLKFLDDPNRALIMLFFIFLIPGIPKDVLIYLVPLTKVKMGKFLITSSIARIPSIISSTFIGSSILNDNYLAASIVFIVFLALAILGLIFNKQIYNFLDKKLFNKKSKKEDELS